MATVKNYYTFGGELIGEQILGGERLDYLSDPLGNVTATVNQSCQIVNSYEEKPYGEQLSKTGSGSDPACRWVGVHGYRSTGLKYAEVYVRRRHYSTELGRWTSKDPLWPQDHAYGYVGAKVTKLIDPSGEFGIDFSACQRGFCGGIKYHVKLYTDEGEPPGWIIQYVSIKITRTECDPKPRPNCPPCTVPLRTETRGWEFYEAWRVNERGQIFTMCPGPPWTPIEGPFDTFEYPDDNQCTKGEGKWYGRIKFFKNYHLTSPPWTCNCQGRTTGALPCFVPGTGGSRRPPGYDPSGSLRHEMKMEWDCCPNLTLTQVTHMMPPGRCVP